LISCAVISGGLANTNCKLQTTKGTFLLKICDEKQIHQLKSLVELLMHLKKHGYFTSFPVPMKEDPNSFVYIEQSENLRAIIFDFLKGSPKPFRDVTVNVMKELGKAVGKLHMIPPVSYLPEFSMGMAEIEPFLDEVKGTKFETHNFVIFLKEQLQRLKPIVKLNSLPQGIVHGDVFADNVMFEGEQVVAIIDFEEVCQAPYMLDVSMTIVGCCYPNGILDKSLMDTFLESYNDVRHLTPEEEKLMKEFIDYSLLSIAFWRFRQFNVRTLDQSLKDKYLEMVNRMSVPYHQ